MSTIRPEVLSEILRRVVAVAAPDRIVLFGSAAKGTMGADSDVDLLVIKGGSYDKIEVCGAVYEALIGVGQAVDIVLVTPEEVDRYRHATYRVIKPALDEGKTVYAA